MKIEKVKSRKFRVWQMGDEKDQDETNHMHGARQTDRNEENGENCQEYCCQATEFILSVEKIFNRFPFFRECGDSLFYVKQFQYWHFI